jgi:hypothetical protein
MARNALHRFVLVFLAAMVCLVTGSGLLAGCVKREPVPVVLPVPVPDDAPTPPGTPPLATDGETAYDRGVRAYDAGAVKKAVAAWRAAVDHETDPAVRQRALFALASVKLAQAGCESELTAALDLLDTWQQNSPPGGSGEDPRFLIPVVHAFKPAYALREAKSAADKECSRKLTEREAQVRHNLQQQVRALETIHREIQEKKKGLTNY